MPVAGYIFVLMGVLLIRQVVTGRAKETPADIRDLAIAFFNADMDGVRAVVGLRGDNVGAGTGSIEVASTPGPASASSNAFAQRVVSVGDAANGYGWGATGPDYYDCSGLIWRVAKDMGIYTGSRFTTHNFARVASPPWRQVQSPQAGDVILWEGKHMGISLGGDVMYSARSVAKGIGRSSISGDSGYWGSAPTYWSLSGEA